MEMHLGQGKVSESDGKRFLRASFSYGVSQVLVFAASLVSFPLLTRLLSVGEYGVLGLCNAALLLGTALGKSGLQNSIVRFYAEYRKRGELDTFYSTFWLGGAVIAATVSLLLVPVFLVFAPAGYRLAFLSVILVVFGMSLFSIASNFLRSEERNDTNASLNVLLRYAGTLGGILLVYLSGAGVAALFLAQFAVLMLLTGWLLLRYRKRSCISARLFSRDLFRQAVSFGLPLIAFELSSVLLAFSDRYLIGYYCGAEELGRYTAGYTLCFYLADLVRQPLQLSVLPIYLRIYADHGRDRTVEFLREALSYLFLVIAPVFAGCVALKSELLVLLASSRYKEAAGIIPWVLGGTLLYGCQPLVAAGFYIQKRTRLFSLILLSGACLNILLNILLIPRFGSIAAAWSTALCYTGVLGVMVLVSNRILPVPFPSGRVACYFLCSAAMFLTVSRMESVPVAGRILFGSLEYCAAVLVLDRRLSRALGSFLQYRLRPSQEAK